MSITRYNKKLKIHEMRTIKELEEPEICETKINTGSKLKIIDLDLNEIKIDKLLVPTGTETKNTTKDTTNNLDDFDKSDKVDFPKKRRNALIISDNEINEIVEYIKK